MLQQTQVKTVIPYYERWLKTFPTSESLAKASIERVYQLWEGLGYYSRARNLKKGAEYIQKELEGKFPDTRVELLKIPGVGPYTAGAIASIAFGKAEPLVDGNVGRVFARLFEIRGIWNEPKTNKVLWEKAHALLSQKYPGNFNEALMELGATVCVKDNPRCNECPVSNFCWAFRRGTIAKYPTTKKSRTEKVEKITLILRKNGKILVRKKKQGKIMGDLWEFPTFIQPNASVSSRHLFSPRSRGAKTPSRQPCFPQEILKREGISVESSNFLGRISHGYTRFKATLDIWEGVLAKGNLNDGDYEKPRWMSQKDLRKITFPAVHRKIAERFY